MVNQLRFLPHRNHLWGYDWSGSTAEETNQRRNQQQLESLLAFKVTNRCNNRGPFRTSLLPKVNEKCVIIQLSPKLNMQIHAGRDWNVGSELYWDR